MAAYTILSKSDFNSILDHYEIGHLYSYDLLHGGSENTNYLATSNTGKYVVCVCEQKSMEKASDLANLLLHLSSKGFNTSKVVLTRNGESVIEFNGKPIMLRVFLEGNVENELNLEMIRLLGKELAQLHRIPPPSYLPETVAYGIDDFHEVNIYAADSDFANWLQEIREYIKPYLELELPRALIHSDIFSDNVVVSEDESELTIMDFEEAASYYRIFDIGMTIIGVCSEEQIVNLGKVSQLINAYKKENTLTIEEVNSLKAFTIYAGAAMTFWRHRNFNYLNPDPSKFEHYQGLKVLVDYLLRLPDNCFVDLLEE